MADPIYPLAENPEYNESLRAIQDSDPALASAIFTPLFTAMLNNTHFVKLMVDILRDSKADLVDGKVPAGQLPSYVDDVLEYATLGGFPAKGESGKIYVAQDTNLAYRWGGSGYVEVSPSLALGETAATAYRGDRGKTAFDHSQRGDNPHGVTAAQVGADPAGSAAGVQNSLNAFAARRDNPHGVTAAQTGAAGKSVQASAAISTAWSGNSPPYTQVIGLAGVTAANVVEVFLPATATADQVEQYQALNLQDGGQAAGSFTLRAFGTKNTTAIPILVIIRGDL